jgi:hypothetical protein
MLPAASAAMRTSAAQPSGRSAARAWNSGMAA